MNSQIRDYLPAAKALLHSYGYDLLTMDWLDLHPAERPAQVKAMVPELARLPCDDLLILAAAEAMQTLPLDDNISATLNRFGVGAWYVDPSRRIRFFPCSHDDVPGFIRVSEDVTTAFQATKTKPVTS